MPTTPDAPAADQEVGTAPSPEKKPQTALLVLGMHRSGTSALTRVVNLLGVDLGTDLMEAAEGNNERGFWEHQGVVTRHDRLLADLGMRWDDPRAMPQDWLEHPATKAARADLEAILDAEFSDAALWGVKDPRMCRLLPLWRQMLEARGVQATVLHMLRHPLEIARSLERRDAMPRGRALMLWLRHQIEALTASDGAPQSWASFDRLMAGWRGEMERVDADLHLGFGKRMDGAAAEIDGFLDVGLRHHALDDDILKTEPALAAWIGRVYDAVRLADGGDRDAALATVREVQDEIDRASYYFDDTFADWAGLELRLREEIDVRDNRIRLLDDSVQERDGRVAERDSRIAERERMIDDRDRTIGALEETVASLRDTIEDLRDDVSDLQSEVKDRDGHIHNLAMARIDLQNHIQALESSTSWRVTKPLRKVGNAVRRARRVTHTLKPGELFRAKHVEGDVWEATDTFSVMVLQSDRGRMPTGWVELTYGIKADRLAAPSLFADTGSGTAEIDRKRLPVTDGNNVTCFVRLPDDVKGLRLDPISWKGRFEMGPIRAREITRLELLRVLATNAYAQEGIRPIVGNLRRGGVQGLKEYLIKKLPKPIETYDDWRDLFYALTDSDRAAIRAHVGRMENKPVFSVVMPTYETPPALLEKAVESVKAQLYDAWELCIADDGSKNPEIRAMLTRYAAEDPRIKVVFRETNGHISAASNSALEIATGDWIALLDHDDELTEDALYWMAASLEANPDADILYSDEDKIDEEGRVSDPYFKPDWSPELFLSQNMINHLGVYRRSLVEKAGRFREGFEGSQDYDLALRVLDQTTTDRVRHIPAVLYHWRMVAGSVALGTGEKTYPYERARKAIAEHLERNGVKAEVIAGRDGFSHRVVPALPARKPHVTIIVPTRDRVDMMRMVVTGLLEKTAYPNWDLIIVDNGSEKAETLEYFAEIQKDDRIAILRDDAPFNFSRLNNLAAAEAKGPLLLLLNNDIEPIDEGWLEEMVRQLQRPGVGAVGAKLYYPNDTVQHVGVTTGIGGVAGHFDKHLPREAPGYFSRAQLIHNVTATTAACLLTTKKIYKQVGGMNENELRVAFNDVDFCLKIRAAGHRIVLTPYAELYHHESVSRGLEDTAEKRDRFRGEMMWMRNKWGDALDADPYFNPNLSLDQETPTFAIPPRVPKPWELDDADSGDWSDSA
ncbi:glycosyltransferase [Thalassobaculum sp.]|uniref:glycosyltransferase n=1 Tax=Thalassobaculum sp. TaxID=2022740 RepID=UPI003B5BE8F1